MAATKSIQEHWHIRVLTYRVADALAILGAWLFAYQSMGIKLDQSHTILVVLAILMFHFVGEITGMYRNWRGVNVEREIVCAVLTYAICMPILISSIYLFQLRHLNIELMWRWLIVSLLAAATIRSLLRMFQAYLRTKGFNTRGFAVVGINDLGNQLAKNIQNAPEMGLRLVGFFDDRDETRTPEPALGERVGDISRLVEQARSGEVSMIYITFPMRAEDRIRNVLNALADTTASVYIVPDFFVFELLHSRWTSIGGLPAVSVFENPFYGVDGLVKRGLDVAFASILLVMLAIPMSIIGLLVKWTSKGPIFFRQKRYGLDGREIYVWKFRSMTCCDDGPTVQQATKNDNRVTPLGAILRKTSLDELPQLFNVMNGTMSLVGPRPHANAHNEQYRTQILGYMLRHKVKPGITGLAQVNGYRGETDTLEKMEKRIECDHQYIRNWSLMMDLKILFRTLFVVFSRQNAY